MAFLLCFFIGFLMCIPIGPINVWVMNITLKKSRSHALLLAGGGASMDFFYFLVILSGLSFIQFSESFSFGFKTVGIVLIFILGIKEFISKPSLELKTTVELTKKDGLGLFALGAFLYLSNPTLIVTMSAIGSFIKSLSLYEFTPLNIGLSSIGLSVGAFAWFILLTALIQRFETLIREKYLSLFNKISGALMILCSAFMSYKILT